mmetsp:Transcript_122699/g.291810  ORF Transcript_122699/g.291810 Transcript_122699/m.291810 type:complete len:110 (+) Transcript_122699:452-781(+)
MGQRQYKCLGPKNRMGDLDDWGKGRPSLCTPWLLALGSWLMSPFRAVCAFRIALLGDGATQLKLVNVISACWQIIPFFRHCKRMFRGCSGFFVGLFFSGRLRALLLRKM